MARTEQVEPHAARSAFRHVWRVVGGGTPSAPAAVTSATVPPIAPTIATRDGHRLQQLRPVSRERADPTSRGCASFPLEGTARAGSAASPLPELPAYTHARARARTQPRRGPSNNAPRPACPSRGNANVPAQEAQDARRPASLPAWPVEYMYSSQNFRSSGGSTAAGTTGTRLATSRGHRRALWPRFTSAFFARRRKRRWLLTERGSAIRVVHGRSLRVASGGESRGGCGPNCERDCCAGPGAAPWSICWPSACHQSTNRRLKRAGAAAPTPKVNREGSRTLHT